jgi:hypothetical protein
VPRQIEKTVQVHVCGRREMIVQAPPARPATAAVAAKID